MFTSTVILTGTVVIEGVAFRWSVTDGFGQRLTVSHPVFGSQAQQLVRSPQAQARSIGRALLAAKVRAADIDCADDIGIGMPETDVAKIP
jgi:hypothetical protein